MLTGATGPNEEHRDAVAMCACCGRSYSGAQWRDLDVKPWDDMGLDLARCATVGCGSQMSVPK